MPSEPPVPPQTVEAPAAPTSRVPFDLLLAPERGVFRALRHPDFRLFWSGNFLSNIGTWMHYTAQAWLVWELTDSPLWLGILGFAQYGPALMFSLLGGVIADRTERRRLLFTTQSAMLVLALTLAVLVWTGRVTVPQILVLAFLSGTTMALNAPSYQAALRDLVGREETLNAIALNSIQFNLSRLLGPSIAGFVIAGINVTTCFFLNALSYLALLYAILKVKFRPRELRLPTSVRVEIGEGFRYVWNHRQILVLVGLVAMVSMFGLPYVIMLPAFATDVLGLGARGYGYLSGAPGAGALVGGLHLAMFKAHRRRGPLVLGATITFFAVLVLFCISRQPVVSALLLALAGAAAVNSVATVNSLIQTFVPDVIRGRVLSMHTMAFLGFTPLGSLLVGALAERFGPPMALGISGGFALLLTAGVALAAPSVRRLQ